MLGAVSQAEIMRTVTLYSRPLCGWCLEAKEYLRQHQIDFVEVDIGRDPAAAEEMVKLSGQRYVPTIVVDGQVLANFDVAQLEEFLKKIGT